MEAAPTVETIRWAETTTATAQRVRVLITKVESESARGWLVYGYRQYTQRARLARQTSYPQLYWIAR